MNISNVKKGEMLLEAISSDDDIAMDSEEDGVLVFLNYKFINNFHYIIILN